MGKNKDRDISEEEDNKEEKKDKKEKKEKKEKSKEKVLLKITSLERKLQTLKALSSNDVALTKKYSTTIHDKEIRCDKDVRINVGPIIGKVTSTSAIVLIEVSLSVELIVHLIPVEGSNASASYAKQVVPKNRPKVIEGVNAKDASRRIGRVKTVANETEIDKTKLKFVTVSCDRPERLRDGETNMWIKLADEVKNGNVDVLLHLGDQVYGQKEFQDAQAVLRFSGTPRGADASGTSDKNVLRLHKNIKERIRDIYRFTWNLPGTAYVLSHTSNLMIWSDNDIYNDFTIAKEEHEENLEPIMLYLAHQVYREYQRQLWDLNYEQEKTTDEFHFHRWGSTGVFIHDMRGNRITTKGEQRPDNPILNDAQWNAFTSFVQDPSLKNLIICSEIPYVGDEPETAKELAKKPELEFLKDHWVYSDKELVKLFELVFDWKAADKDGRDVVFVGGDIHVGVTSTIHDAKTNIDVVHLTSTPISNHVCQFFCKLQGKVNDRFSYTHIPLLKCRNYGLLEPTYEEGKAHIAAKLVAGEPTGKHHH